MAAKTTKKATAKKSTKKASVKVNKDTKVEKISAENHKAVKDRAKAIQKRLEAHFNKTGSFPSHNYVIEKWGFAICAKAVLRHKRQVCKKLNIEMPETDPASKLKRKAKAKA